MGASLLVSINASPFNKGKMKVRCEMVSHRAKAAGVPIVFVNLVGGNDGIIFDGSSIVSDATGRIVMQAPPFEEFIGTVDLGSGLADTRCLPGDEIETVRPGPRTGHSRLRAQEQFHHSRVWLVRRH